LVASFRAIAKNVHPDRFTNEPREVRNLATNLTAELNQAVRVLHDPVRRADYMLERAGGPSAGQVRDVPGNFLAEVMMLREEIDDARTAADAATLERHQSGLNARREDALRRIADVADRLATASDNEKMEFRKLLNAIKYFDNLLAELAVDPLETAMGAVRG
jgi:molecular chaperone HscB